LDNGNGGLTVASKQQQQSKGDAMRNYDISVRGKNARSLLDSMFSYVCGSDDEGFAYAEMSLPAEHIDSVVRLLLSKDGVKEVRVTDLTDLSPGDTNSLKGQITYKKETL
jgi:hypothetical protein